VVGRLKEGNEVARFHHHRPNHVAKSETRLTASEPMTRRSRQLLSVNLWTMEQIRDVPRSCAPTAALALAFEQPGYSIWSAWRGPTGARDDKLDAAGRLFEQARTFAPHDRQPDAGCKSSPGSRDGTITASNAETARTSRKGGSAQCPSTANHNGSKSSRSARPGRLNSAPRQHGDRRRESPQGTSPSQAVEEQKMQEAVEDVIRQARVNIKKDPDGTAGCAAKFPEPRQGSSRSRAAPRQAMADALQSAGGARRDAGSWRQVAKEGPGPGSRG